MLLQQSKTTIDNIDTWLWFLPSPPSTVYSDEGQTPAVWSTSAGDRWHWTSQLPLLLPKRSEMWRDVNVN